MPAVSSAESQVNARPPCNNCREKHVKCEPDETSCVYCRKNGIECVRRQGIRFSHRLNPSIRSKRRSSNKKYDYSFDERQPWMKTNRSLHFVDETHDVIFVNGPNSDDSPSPSDKEERITSPLPPRGGSWSPPNALTADLREPLQFASASPATSRRSDPSELMSDREPKATTLREHGTIPRNKTRFDALCSVAAISEPLTAPLIPSHIENLHDEGIPSDANESNSLILDYDPSIITHDASLRHSIQRMLSELRWDSSSAPIEAHTPSSSVSDLYRNSPNWPLQDPEEAHLLHFFVENLAPFFDLCDAERKFQTVVPFRAAWCPPLLNALLAASAKRLSRISDFDSVIGDKYHQECLKTLIPALCDPEAATDENILTAIVVLRYMEEVDVQISPASQSHLIGTRVFLAAQEKVCEFKGLRLAAFWVALRQEIYMAFLHNRPVHESYALDNCDWLLIHTNNVLCNYANRIIIHCARCLRFCYGSSEQSAASWEEMWEFLQEFENNMPLHFKPIHQQPLSEAFFPRILYLDPAAVTGMQHYYLVRILLLAHDPRIPKLGLTRAAALKKSNTEIKELARMICGIAESNPKIVPASVNSYVAITMAGDRFTEKHEQKALLQVLAKLDRDWPTSLALTSWREAWGIEERSEDETLDTS